jgi:DNA-binding response OmpR family regulator
MAETVAIFNTSEDTTEVLRIALEHEGYVVVTAFTHFVRDGKTDVEAFMRQHRPKVIIYDIALPYEENWRLFTHLRDSPACQGVCFVITTTNEKHVRAVAGPQLEVLEIVGKPYDLGILSERVRACLGSRRDG